MTSKIKKAPHLISGGGFVEAELALPAASEFDGQIPTSYYAGLGAGERLDLVENELLDLRGALWRIERYDLLSAVPHVLSPRVWVALEVKEPQENIRGDWVLLGCVLLHPVQSSLL